MPYKDSEKQKKAQHEWYLKNKELTYQRMVDARAIRREWFEDYKRTLKCEICGLAGDEYPQILSFHHTNPETKEGNIAQMVNWGKSRESVLCEISKCQVICENCHRKIHHAEYSTPKRNKSAVERYIKLKENFCCELCGEKHSACLDFVYKKSEDKKKWGFSTLHNKSLDKLMAELEKCKCICANCNRKFGRS